MQQYTAVSISARLSEPHRVSLQQGSGIHPDVIAERGVHTVRHRSGLPPQFKGKQRRRGILFPTFSADGTTRGHQLRPDAPIKPGRKYEQPTGVGCVLDVHPRNMAKVGDAAVDLFVTEGIKKGDAITSASPGDCTISLAGVWNWQRGGELLPDWEHVELEGRRVYLAFDSDAWRNPQVQLALERLAGQLKARGAEVLVVYLPDSPDGSKVGADDFLVAGGTVEGMKGLARPFDPEDMGRERLGRSGELAARLAALEEVRDGMPAKSRRDCSKRAALGACILRAERYGEPVEGGVRVTIDGRTGGELAAMGQRTFARCMDGLVEDGTIRRDDRDRKREHAATYVLLTGARASGSQRVAGAGKVAQQAKVPHGEPEARGGETPHGNAASPAGEPKPRALVPELRWPYVAARQDKDELGRPVEVYEYVARLGKKRGAVVEHLLASGGEASVVELMERFAGPKTRPRDFKRRLLADLAGHRREYQGTKLSVGPPIVEIDGDTVRLLPDWREALEHHRTLGGEQGAADRQRINHELQRAGFREYLKHRGKPDPLDRPPPVQDSSNSPEELVEAWENLVPHDGEIGELERVADLDDWEQRFCEMEGAAQEVNARRSGIPENPVEPAPAPAPGADGVIHHGPECSCWMCGDLPEPRYVGMGVRR